MLKPKIFQNFVPKLQLALVCSFFYFLSTSVSAQNDLTWQEKKIYDHIYNLQLPEAKHQINLLQDNNIIKYYLNSSLEFMVVFTTENQQLYKQYETNKSQYLERIISSSQTNTPFYRYTQAEIHLQWAFLRLIFKENLSAAKELRKSLSLIKENIQLFPDFLPNKKTLGLLQVIIGNIPDNYKWLGSLTGLDGDTDEGLKNLQFVFNTACKNQTYSYLKNETFLLIGHIVTSLTKNKVFINNFYNNSLKEIEKNTPTTVYTYAKIELALGKNDQAIQTLFTHHFNNDNYYPLTQLNYLKGIVKINKLDVSAEPHFKTFVQQFKGKSYIKSAYQKLAWVAALNNDAKAYFENLDQLLKHGNTNLDEDNQAQKEALKKRFPNIYLLKARLLFDGAYYKQALELLLKANENKQFTTDIEQLEFTYRMARIFHETNQLEKAIPFYELTYKKGLNIPVYYAANSALQLGYIYESQNDFQMAKSYFKKCLALKNHEYVNSLSQKAKAGLKRIE